MRFLTREKEFYGRLARISIPIALQNLLGFSVSMADTIMVGMLGEVYLSAAALGNQLGFIYALFTFGVGGGANVMIAQFWGRGDVKSIHKVITIMYRLLIAGGLIFTVIAVFFGRQVMAVFSTDPMVVEAGGKYLRVLGWSFVLMGLSSTTVVMLRSVGSVRISLLVYISSLATNVFFNWALIFGNLGFPRLEIEGAAIATCFSRVAEIIIVLVYMLAVEKKIRYKIKYIFMRKMSILRQFVKTSGPVVINEFLWGLGSATISVVVGRMSTEFTAAYSICNVLGQLVMVTVFGAANAAAVLVGNTVGAGDYEKAKLYGRTFVFLSAGMGLVSAGVVQLLRVPMISLYNVSEQVRLYAGQITHVYSVVVVFLSISATTLIGTLRGGGDTRFVLLMDVLFMWTICIPFGFITGLWLGFPVVAVYAVIKSDELFKTVFSIIRVFRGKWVNDITNSNLT